MRQLKVTCSITQRDGDALERYLQEISRVKAISPDEEEDLATRIKKGDKEALERLTRANLRFVVSVAKQYQGQGLSLSDLINEGNMGLITAAKRFDETRGFKFISYAVWWIRQNILQALAENSRLIRLPLNQVGHITPVNNYVNRFYQENERYPTKSEIAEALNLEEEKVQCVLMAINKHQSADAPLNEDDNSSLIDTLCGEQEEETDAMINSESLKEDVCNALSDLSVRERSVVCMFFGIDGPAKGLVEIGKTMRLSRERVRQIKENAIHTLQHSKNANTLRNYLG
jgi:RNA polymerase primary sigma factor